jgi:hypothetical protein
MTRYAKRKLKYSLNENFNLLSYVEWDRFVTLTGAQAEWGLRYRIYPTAYPLHLDSSIFCGSVLFIILVCCVVLFVLVLCFVPMKLSILDWHFSFLQYVFIRSNCEARIQNHGPFTLWWGIVFWISNLKG